MAKPQRLLHPLSRLAIALAALGASLSVRCGGTDEGLNTTPEGDSSAGAGAGGESSAEPPGGAPGRGVCEPGATRTCIGAAACRGGQQCADDGSRWSACDCGSTSGGGGSTSGGGGEAAGGAGGGGTPISCAPAPQSGCAEGEKCAIFVDAEALFVSFTCVPNGDKAEGEACGNRGDGTDDCAQGLFCNGVGTVPRCQPYCDVDDRESCDTFCTGLDVGHGGAFVPSGYGVCQPPCDLLEQDCSDGDACVFLESEFPVCAAPGEAAPGEACLNYDDCEVGSACVLANAEKTSSMCTPFCEATQPGACEAAGETCLAFPMLYDVVPEGMLTMGLCYPCALLGIEGCELLEPGGCEAPADCQPLLGEMGFAYTCSLPAGQCVLLDP